MHAMWCLVSAMQVRLSPSDILSGVLALGLATAELTSHHTSFTLNNMVRFWAEFIFKSFRSAL
jgi:hypothetical protein